MEYLRLDVPAKVALTWDDTLNKVILWEPGNGASRVFTNGNNEKILLSSDNGRWWDSVKKSTEFCEYAELWQGEYPFDSWCWGIRRCLTTGKIITREFYTEINPRGITASEQFIRDCLTYMPDTALAV